MPLLSELIDRIQFYTQDYNDGNNGEAWERAQVMTQLQQESIRLARKKLFGEVVWIQAIANKGTYRLDEQAIYITGGTDDSGSSSLTVLTDSSENFTTLGVLVGDRVRNLADGCTGLITTVGTTTVTCLGTFSGGILNQMTSGDTYIIERPLSHLTVTGVDHLLYNGVNLRHASEEGMDRLRPGWEQATSGIPKRWTTDNAETPTILRVSPAPTATGSSIPVFPGVPLAMPYEYNFVAYVTVEPQGTYDEANPSLWMDAFIDPLVFQTVGELLGHQGDYNNPSVSAAMKELSKLFLKELGAA